MPPTGLISPASEKTPNAEGGAKQDLEAGLSVLQGIAGKENISDRLFGDLLTVKSRRAARQHWTPIAVAKRAAELLTNGESCNVLDVGSGVGKFCIVGALTSKGNFLGVERRVALVREARELSHAFGIPRVKFVCQEMGTLDWSGFDAIYLYNPFQENIDQTAQIDESFELTEEHYSDFVRTTQEKLAQTRLGTRVVTFHGFGGKFPAGYENTVREPWSGDFLELWVKRDSSLSVPVARAPDFYFEGPCTD